MEKLRVVGSGIFIALAIACVAAPAASADEFTAEELPASLTAKTNPGTTMQFLVTVGPFLCNNPAYGDVTATTPTTSISVTPDFTAADCTTLGLPVAIDMNGCTYRFNIGGGVSTAGDLDLLCPAGSEVTYTLTPLKCIIHVKAQNDIGGTLTYSNTGAGSTREISVSARPEGIDYTHTSGGGLGACQSGSSTKGAMAFDLTITAETPSASSHIGIFMSNI